MMEILGIIFIYSILFCSVIAIWALLIFAGYLLWKEYKD